MPHFITSDLCWSAQFKESSKLERIPGGIYINVQLQNIFIHSFHTTNLFHEGIISNPTHTLETNVCIELKRVQNLYTQTNYFYYKSDSEISKGKRVKIELTDDIYLEIPEFAPLQVI